MPFYPMNDYLPGGLNAGVQPWVDLVQGHGTECNSGLCQDMRSGMDAMSNMWRGAPLYIGSVQSLQYNHAHNIEGALTCEYTLCQQMQSAMRSMCNMWGVESRTTSTYDSIEALPTVCGRGENCLFFVANERHRRAGYVALCDACGLCPSCSRQCDYSESYRRENSPRQCCQCLLTEHHHCNACESWIDEGTGSLCDECLEREESEYEGPGYDFHNTDVTHLLYNCDSCGRQVGSCTCVLAYL